MGTTTDWRTIFVASAALMLRVKAKKKWPGWSDTDREVAKSACRQAAEDIEGIPALRARAEAAEQRAEALAAEVARLRAEGFAAGVNAAVEALEWRAEAMSGSGHHGYAHEMREARKAVLALLAEAQPAEVADV